MNEYTCSNENCTFWYMTCDTLTHCPKCWARLIAIYDEPIEDFYEDEEW